jgi:hypothetical protein
MITDISADIVDGADDRSLISQRQIPPISTPGAGGELGRSCKTEGQAGWRNGV